MWAGNVAEGTEESVVEDIYDGLPWSVVIAIKMRWNLPLRLTEHQVPICPSKRIDSPELTGSA